MFEHNGHLPDIERSKMIVFDRYRPVGTTDSEHAFCPLLEFAKAMGHEEKWKLHNNCR